MSRASDAFAQGMALLAAGDAARAQQSFETAVALEPRVARHWALLGRCQATRTGYHAARTALSRACELDPNAAYAQVWLGHALREQNEPDAAIAAFERARALDPDDVTAAFGAALMTPVVYRGQDEIDRWRVRVREGLAQLAQDAATRPGWSSSIAHLEWSNFHLAYQGGNDRELQIAYSELVARIVGRTHVSWQEAVPARSGERIEVAFVSANVRRHTVTDYFASWITDLPRERFRVLLFHAGGATDERTRELAAAADRFTHIPDDAFGLAAALRAAAPDVIVYPDVGMSPIDALLVSFRLAPVQVAAWGHPVTTGSAFVDAYLSCAAMEPAEAHAHYREELVLLPGIGVRYPRRRVATDARREPFRLPADAHVYVCPQTLFKIHPATDALLLDVLQRDSQAVLVFVASPAKGQTDALLARLTGGLQARGIPMRNQVKLLPVLPRATFLDLLAVSDVMLDALHWSGGNTSLDALSMMLPIVTLPGAQMRGRQSAGMLELMDMHDLVATDADDYVAKALRIAGDPAYRASLSSRIRQGWSRVFDRAEPVAAFAAALDALHDRRRA